MVLKNDKYGRSVVVKEGPDLRIEEIKDRSTSEPHLVSHMYAYTGTSEIRENQKKRNLRSISNREITLNTEIIWAIWRAIAVFTSKTVLGVLPTTKFMVLQVHGPWKVDFVLWLCQPDEPL